MTKSLKLIGPDQSKLIIKKNFFLISTTTNYLAIMKSI